jgi:hypothetical protein
VTDGGAWAGCGPGDPPSGFGSAFGAELERLTGLGFVTGTGGDGGGGGLGSATSISRWTTSAVRLTGTLKPVSKAKPSAA